MVPLWLGPDGSPADELGYALRVSARVAFIALLLGVCSTSMAQAHGQRAMVDGKPALPWSRGGSRAFSAHFAYIVALFALTKAAGSRYSDLWWLCLPMYLGHGLD